jgi:putative flippase GtrA
MAQRDPLALDALPASPPRPRFMQQLLHKLMGYVLVGGMAAVVDVGLFHWLEPRLASIFWAAAASFTVGAVFNYSLSSVWVYRQRWASWRRAALFAVFASVGLMVNSLVTWWLAMHFPIAPTLAKMGGVGLAFGINFLMNTFIVFRVND